VLLTKNEIKAVKKLVFTVIRRTLKISKIKDVDFDACDVDLQSVLVWAIREQQLYGCEKDEMEFNTKLDGRPLGGACMEYCFTIQNELTTLIDIFAYLRSGEVFLQAP